MLRALLWIESSGEDCPLGRSPNKNRKIHPYQQVCKSQFRHTRNMKGQDTMMPLADNLPNPTISCQIQRNQNVGKTGLGIKSLFLKMVND